MKVALVHDWLFHMRGGEKVLESLAEIYPDATIYTLFHDLSKVSPSLAKMKVEASFLQKLPGIKRYYRWLLPFLPFIIKSFKLDGADVVISSSHCVAKGVSVPEGAIHICYCHTPMRYVWGFEEEYFSKFPSWVRDLMRPILGFLRKWDLESNKSVTEFVSNSENVKKRIRDFYKRDARVIYPPLDRKTFQPEAKSPKDYYLVVSAFVPYKRVDLVIEAFNELDQQLLIVGSGPMDTQYRSLRRSERISFFGSVTDKVLKQLYSEAKAVIFPTNEDFGIVPLEAQTCGTPVIALGEGGALESVKSGVFFNEQTPEAIREAIAEFEKKDIDRSTIAEKVAVFDKDCFKEKIKSTVTEVLGSRSEKAAPVQTS